MNTFLLHDEAADTDPDCTGGSQRSFSLNVQNTKKPCEANGRDLKESDQEVGCPKEETNIDAAVGYKGNRFLQRNIDYSCFRMKKVLSGYVFEIT